MAHHRHLPIWKAALSLAVHLEQAVRRFSRYHKYTLGQDLRQSAQRMCVLVSRANDASGAARAVALDALVLAVEEIKTQIALTQEIGGFASFNDFAQATELAVALGKQSGGWRRRVRSEASPMTGPTRWAAPSEAAAPSGGSYPRSGAAWGPTS